MSSNSFNPTAFVILGATGDLSQRSLMPALFDLYMHGLTPRQFKMIGIGSSARTDAEFVKILKNAIRTYSESRAKIPTKKLNEFCSLSQYYQLDLTDPSQAKNIEAILDKVSATAGATLIRIIYNSLPPAITEQVLEAFKICSFDKYCTKHLKDTRMVIEKPFGTDLASAKRFNRLLRESFFERQIYRIDHYLGKEALQDILVFRFGNTIIEPLMSKHFVDNIQVTVAEDIGIGDRARYYDNSGALRDMVVNHLTQILAYTIMEMPATLGAEDLRYARASVIRHLRVARSNGKYHAVRGQYAGYQLEKGVARDSTTETFAAVELACKAPRWDGVPMYLRTGKRMAQKLATVTIEFKKQHCSFIDSKSLKENTLTLRLQPEPGITTKINTKKPSFQFEIAKTQMDFCYRDHYASEHPGSYEKLFVEIFKGDQEHFPSPQAVESQWRLYEPLLRAWEDRRKYPVLKYDTGGWGPKTIHTMLGDKHKHTTRHWHAENIDVCPSTHKQ